MHTITGSHANFDRIKEKIKQIGAAQKEGPSSAYKVKAYRAQLDDLTDIPMTITKASSGKVTVRDGRVYYGDEIIHNAVTTRILWGLSEGYDMSSYVQFLDNLMDNPSKRALDETYTFLERNNMGITDDGHILAYKRVRADYLDIHSGTMDNSIGKVVSMPRNKVDDNKDKTCSEGLHFCSLAYLPHYGVSSGNRVVIVKVNPRDIVSVPADYDAAKVRCCRYEVIGEMDAADLKDVLATKPVWTTDEIAGHDTTDTDDQIDLGELFDESAEYLDDYEPGDFVDADDTNEDDGEDGDGGGDDDGVPTEPFDVVLPIAFTWVNPSNDIEDRQGTLQKVNFNAEGQGYILVKHGEESDPARVVLRSYRLVDIEKVTDTATGETFAFMNDLLRYLWEVKDAMPMTVADMVDVSQIIPSVVNQPVTINVHVEDGQIVLKPSSMTVTFKP